jgi:predicted RND superfamily exporter protein
VEAAGDWLPALTAFVSRRHGWITAASVGLMLVVGAGLLKLETSVKLLNLFSPQATIIRDYTWLEEHLGPLVPVEVVVQFDRDHPLSVVDRLELVSQVQNEIDRIEKVGGTMSAATFVPPLPEGGGFSATARRAVLSRRLAEAADIPALANYLRESDDGELWRISARVEALNSLDYGYFMEQLRGQIDPLIGQRAEEAGGAIRVAYTGVMPLVYKAQRELLSDLTKSFVSAFLLIAVVMAVMLYGVGAGLVSMLPNVFPAVIMFGSMGWSGLLCDIGSMMTASVALGIAVDDTIHFLSWFRRGIGSGLSRQEAIRLAYERCAGAMLQTTLIAGLGLLVFAMSGFVPTARFAWLMFTLLGTALIGDLLFLPALLAGPLGRLFERRHRTFLTLPKRCGDSSTRRRSLSLRLRIRKPCHGVGTGTVATQ